MNRERQKRAPIYEALEKFRRQRVVPFDVPGHKRGRGNPELVELLGAGEVVDGVIDVLNYVPQPRTIRMDPERVNALIEAFVQSLKGGETPPLQGGSPDKEQG